MLSADEQTSIRTRRRRAPTTAPRPGQAARVGHEYERGGALAGCPLGGGRCGATTGIAPFDRLVDRVMALEL